MILHEHDQPAVSLSEIITNPNLLFDDVFKNIEALKINLEGLILDHLGYRCFSTDEYLQISRSLSVNGLAKLISEDQVRGRRIAVFELTQPIMSHGFKIDCVEIIEPKQGDANKYSHQLEHAEFVLTEKSLQEFAEQHPHIDFDRTDMNRPNNPELRIKLQSGRTIGFHTIALIEYVT